MPEEAKGKEVPSYSHAEVAEHTGRESLWLIMNGKVYDVTEYTDKHPGGPDKFLDNAGRDVTKEFAENHNSKIPQFIAQNYEIGTVKKKTLKDKRDSEVFEEVKEAEKVEATKVEPKKADDKGSATFSAVYQLTVAECSCVKKQFTQLAEVAGGVIEAGNLLYEALFTALGDARGLFKSPKKVLAFRFISQIERFVLHGTDEVFLETELYNLSMRHLAYVTHQHLTKYMHVFIDAIVTVIKNALDEYWNVDAERAWRGFLGYLGGHLLKNALEFGGKVNLLRSSWGAVENIGKNSSSADAAAKSTDRTGGFGEALFFNIGVMSPEIMALIIRDRSELARLFTGGFNMMVTQISDPPVFNEELYILAARHLEYGTEEHHFPVFGQAVMVTLRSLLPRAWNWAHEDAWGWLWTMASKFMITTISNGHSHKQRLDDSNTRLEGVDMDELGMQFYGILFASSMEVQQYFYKPNSLIKFIVSKVIVTIISLLHSPDEVTHQIRALGMRHIKYAIPPDLFPLFGIALVGTLPSFLEGFWDENIRDAWATVFEFVKDCMTRAVVSGTNLVTKALCNNDAAECEDALNAAPRCERIMWLLEIDVSNIKVSPFGWALQDGKLDVGKFMLQDILTIRADREAYYFGKDILFRVHPDVIRLLCKLAPQMLTDVFDGLMWHSRNIEDGKRRVNYYVRDVYGDPNDKAYEDTYLTPMADLVTLNNATLFVHPFCLFVLDLKWTQFGRQIYMRTQCINILLVIFFMAGWVGGDPEGDPQFVCRIIELVLVAFVLLTQQIPRIGREIAKLHLTHVIGFIYLPTYLTKGANLGRLVLNMALVAAFATDIRFRGDDRVQKELSEWMQGIACALMWGLMLELAHVSVEVLQFQHKLGAVSHQLVIFLVALAFAIMGFATSFTLITAPTKPMLEFGTLDVSILSLINVFIGVYNFQLTNFIPLMLVLYIAFSIFSMFLLLRLLFAIFATITIEQSEHVEGFAYLERGELTLELESNCSLSFRKGLWDSMGLERPLEFDAGDLGPNGGVQRKEQIGRQMSQRAADDRIKRFPGECDPGVAWPRITTTGEKTSEERVDKLAAIGERMRRNLVELQKKGIGKAGAGGGALPTLSEGESGTGAGMQESGTDGATD